MEEDDGAICSSFNGRLHALKVQTPGLLGEVGILNVGNADIGEYLLVIDPCRVGEVDLLGARVEPGEEQGAEMEGAGTGDGLDGVDTLLLDGGRIGTTKDELGGLACEGRDTDNRGVLVVEVGVIA
jgi:hypothetical protein